LHLAEHRLAIDRPATQPFWSTLLQLRRAFTEQELLWLALGSEVAAVALWLAARKRRVLRWLAWPVVFAALAVTGDYAQRRWFPGPPLGVVLLPQIELRSEPRADLPVVLTIKAGEEVRVENAGAADRWVFVRHAEGRGWTAASGVGVVD
jgi:hypothetical protein